MVDAAPRARAERGRPGKLTPRREFLHDLALELGAPVENLAARLTEREFRAWQHYAARRMLPQRRIELYLAQIAMLIAQTMGGAADVSLEDFLFDPPPADDDGEPLSDDEHVETARDFFGFSPVKDAPS